MCYFHKHKICLCMHIKVCISIVLSRTASFHGLFWLDVCGRRLYKEGEGGFLRSIVSAPAVAALSTLSSVPTYMLRMIVQSID